MICSVALLLTQFLGTVAQVYAISQNPVVTVGEIPPGLGTYERDGTQATISLAFIYADNEIVFCIDPRVLVDSGRIYNSGELRAGAIYDSSGYRLTESQLENIQQLIFWGWDMSDDKSITQYIKVQGAIYAVLGWQLPYNLSDTVTIDDVNAVITEVNKHTTNTVSFDGETHTVESGKSITLTDNNKNLQYLDFSDKDGWQFKKTDNSVTITATPNAKDTTVYTRNSKLYGQAKTNLLLSSQGSQTVIAFKDPDYMNAFVNLRVTKSQGGIEIHKKDGETGQALSGVEFGLFEKGSNTPLKTAVTDSTGIVRFDNVASKSFDIKETRTRDTYRLNNETFSVTVQAGKTTVVNATNVSKKIRVRISKTFEKGLNGTNKAIFGKGVTFDIISLTTNKIVQSITTDEKGEALSQELPVTSDYRIEERAVEGYHKAEPIIVKSGTEDGKILHYTIENKVKQSRLKVVKVDADTNQPIKVAGISFQLFKNGQKITQSVNGVVVDTFRTDNNGEVNFPENLVYGTYELKEVQAPTGYVLSDKPVSININGEETTVTVTIKNAIQKGQIEVSKKGKVITAWTKNEKGVFIPTYSEQLLGGATFKVTQVGTNNSFEIKTQAGQVTKTKELPLGEYELVEVSAPNGYVLDSIPKRVSLTPQSQTVRLDIKSVSVLNERQSLTIPVEKTFEQSVFNHEQQATIGLYVAENYTEGATTLPKDSLVGIQTVSQNSKVTFEHLPRNMKVYVKEISSSNAYTINQNAVAVVLSKAPVTETGVMTSDVVKIDNKLKRGNFEIVKVDASSQQGLEGVTFKLVAITDDTGTEKEVGTYTTAKDGHLNFTDLVFGRYKAIETKALDGYALSVKPIEFTITGDIIPTQSFVLAGKHVKAHTVVTNESKPEVITDATTTSGDKEGYAFEEHIEKLVASKLVIGQEYEAVATQYDSKGNVLTTQTRKFVAADTTHIENFTFKVPTKYVGNIVYGEDLYRNKEKVAVHFDLNNKRQTVKVLEPKIRTQAHVGGAKEVHEGVKENVVDTVTYENFKNQKVIVRTWLVKYGTTDIVADPTEKEVTVNNHGKFEVVMTNVDTSTLPAGKYTAMEQIFDITESGEKGRLITEHTDPKDENQSFTIVKKTLPKTGESLGTINRLFLGFVFIVMSLSVIFIRKKVNKTY